MRRLSDLLGIARETIQKRIAAAGLQPAGTRHAHPVFRLRDVCPVLYGPAQDGDANTDPARMRPSEQRQYYAAQNDRVAYEEKCRQLIPAGEVHAEMAHIAKTVRRVLLALPGSVERDRPGTDPELIAYLDKRTREAMQELADKLGAEDDDVRQCA